MPSELAPLAPNVHSGSEGQIQSFAPGPSPPARVPLAYAELQALAADVVASGLNPSIKNKATATVLMLLCQSEGLDYIEAIRRYHIVYGQPTKKADVVQAEFEARGGKIIWEVTNANICRARFIHPDKAPDPGVTIDWDDERVRKAGLSGNTGHVKYPAQTKRARCIMEGIRMIYPAILNGIYSPEELADGPIHSSPPPPQQQTAPVIDVTPHATASPAVVPAPAPASTAEAVVPDPCPVALPVSAPDPAPAPVPAIETFINPASPSGAAQLAESEAQHRGVLNLISDLFDQLGLTPAQRSGALSRRGAMALEDLRPEEARELKDALLAKLPNHHGPSPAGGTGTANPPMAGAGNGTGTTKAPGTMGTNGHSEAGPDAPSPLSDQAPAPDPGPAGEADPADDFVIHGDATTREKSTPKTRKPRTPKPATAQTQE